MELLKGWIVDSVSEYEAKQQQLSDRYNIKGRYAGRVVNGQTIPDVVLKSGKYFIPGKKGLYEINKVDIFVQDL